MSGVREVMMKATTMKIVILLHHGEKTFLRLAHFPVRINCKIRIFYKIKISESNFAQDQDADDGPEDDDEDEFVPDEI